MGSMAGVISGVGSRVRDDNLKRWAYEHEAYNEYANLLGKLAESSNDEDLREKLLAAKFRVMTTPPGGKPSKGDLNLHEMLTSGIRKKVEGGALDVTMPKRVPPPGPSSPGKVDVPGLEKLQQPQDKFASSSQMVDPPGAGPRASMGPSFSMLPPVGPASSVPQLPMPTLLTPPPIPMISKEPGSSAPSPKSGFPSPGFGPGPKNYSPPMQGNPVVNEDLPEVNDDTFDYSTIGEGVPRYTRLPKKPLRDVHEYETASGERRYSPMPLPYDKEEQEQKVTEDTARLEKLARGIGLTNPADIANFISNHPVAHSEDYAAVGNAIYNVHDGTFRYPKFSKDGTVVTKPGDIGRDTDDGHIKWMNPADEKTGTSVFDVVKARLESPAELDRKLDSNELTLLNRNLASGLYPVIQNGEIRYRTQAQAVGQQVPRTIYDPQGVPTTGGVAGVSMNAPPMLDVETRTKITDIDNSLGTFTDIANTLSNPKFQNLTGPIRGRLLMNIPVNQLGGVGAPPEVQQLAQKLNLMIREQVFDNAGKAVAQHEQALVMRSLPTATDTLGQMLNKIEVINQALARSRSYFIANAGYRGNQIPALNPNSGPAAGTPSPAPNIEQPPLGGTRTAAPAARPTGPFKFRYKVDVPPYKKGATGTGGGPSDFDPATMEII